MVAKSHGARRKTRDRLRNPEKMTVNRIIQKFEVGQMVSIKPASNQPAKLIRVFCGI